MSILILSFENDIHTDAVESVLKRKRVDYLKYDYSQFPTRSGIGLSLSGNRPSAFLNIDDTEHSLEKFSAVWYRRPGFSQARLTKDRRMRQYIEGECNAFLSGLPSLMPDAFWLSHPYAQQVAINKHHQLLCAIEVGLSVPDSAIGNDVATARRLLARHDDIAMKNYMKSSLELPLGPVQKIKKLLYDFRHRDALAKNARNPQYLAELEYRARIVLQTQRFSANRAEAVLQSLPACPVILQNYVPKAFELRVTIVGTKIFACAIHTQDVEGVNKVDWRHDTYAFRHERYELPDDIAQKCLALLQRLGLQFACMDMIVTPEGEHVFIETNTGGHWLWIEDLTQMPISEALAELLISGGRA